MGEIEKYIGRRLDGGNVIPVLSAGAHPDAVGIDVAKLGFNLDAERVHKFGANPSIDSADVPEDIWDGSGVYTGFIESFLALRMRSSDGADDGSPAGAGAHTVRVQGLDTSGMFASLDFTLNGVGNISIGNWSRVFRAWVLTAGNPTNTNVGTITIDSTVGGIVMAQILPTIGQTLMATYTVPADYKAAWLLQISSSLRASNAQARSATVAFQWRPFGGAWNTKEYLEIHSYGGLAVLPYPLPQEIQPKTDMRMRVLSVSSNATLVNATFDLYLEPL